jgi:hypothetical protein
MERQGCLAAVKKEHGGRWCSLADNKATPSFYLS